MQVNRTLLLILPVIPLGALFSSGPARAVLEPGNHVRSFVWDGRERQYDLHVPASYDGSAAVPLVIDIHGFSSTGPGQAALSGFRAIAEEEGFLVAFPTGVGVPGQILGPESPSWNAGVCCGLAQSEGVDDVGFVRAIVTHLNGDANLDLRRLYATGLSNGGGMTHRLGCEAANFFAAVAPLAFPIPFADESECEPSEPIPVLMFMGLTDVLVPYEGGLLGLGSAAGSFARWRSTNACGDDPVDQTEVFGESTCEVDTTCSGNVEVGLCSITAMAFDPPLNFASGHVLYVNDDLDLARRTWDFLSRFAREDEPELIFLPAPDRALLNLAALTTLAILRARQSCAPIG